MVEDAIHLYHSQANPSFETTFMYHTEDEVLAERDERLYEAGAASAMMVLTSIEATFRVEYLRRCYARYRDGLSRALRALYRDKGAVVSLSDDLLEAWKNHGTLSGNLVGELRSAFGYRDWLAHGRYWVPKLGRQYDFPSVYDLARKVEAALSSQQSAN